ncbi:transcription factor with AP2 domain(s), putative [Plasmodium gallinaceum]|uniref:Transcription factor with AP2 domain(S), putative n=1 Tax=Plasmodium gallinaceum TaxID=5849 RepID=A0A1J1GRU0_PLAGA|nr:transcription factor with AP2 domain(s), putative [Plasmodium gallinaceum]CRG95216.1 transcription factor with AP2 domain(s), putative [Plasmodium gallinaceum]
MNMNDFCDNRKSCLKKKKKIEKCYNVWESIFSKTTGCSKDEIRKKVAKRKRDKERLLSILYGSVFKGRKYLLYSRKWRGKTLSEIINQDKKNYLNLKHLKNVDNSYFCKLAIGYVDQNDKNYFKKNGENVFMKNEVNTMKKVQPTFNNTTNKRKGTHIEKSGTNNDIEEVYDRLNFLEKRSYKNKYKDNNNLSMNYPYNNRLPNDKCYEDNSDESKVVKYKYLPTGVFYSRVSKSFIANWIDDKTKKQIKIPYKISEFGVEKCMILAILSRNLRISNLNNVLKYYDNLTLDQKEKMLQAIRTTQKSEKLFNEILKQNNKDITNIVNSNNVVSKNNESDQKNISLKKNLIEKKKIKQSYNNSEKLPTGVYFYQGSYVANWWETNQKKQFKVPFKISEYGITRAKNLAIISRLIRSSSAQEVNLLLTQMEQNKNITKLNYTTISNLAFKYIKNQPKKDF